MSNRLKQITTKAKALYKSGKYKKWTDAIKAASKTLTHTVTKKAKLGSAKKLNSFFVKVGDKYQVGDLQYLVTKIGIDKGIEYAMKFKGEKEFDYPSSKRIKYSNLAFDEIFNDKNKIGKISGIKKKSAPKRKTSLKSLHKDSKSHNVNIRVMSGLDKITKKGKKTTVHYSRISGLPSYSDPDMARELELYATNDSGLYYQQRRPILINLSKKYKKGTFDVDKAAKLWRYFVDNSLQKYNKEFGSRGDKWFELMSVHDRNLLAHQFAQETKDEFDLGNLY